MFFLKTNKQSSQFVHEPGELRTDVWEERNIYRILSDCEQTLFSSTIRGEERNTHESGGS